LSLYCFHFLIIHSYFNSGMAPNFPNVLVALMTSYFVKSNRYIFLLKNVCFLMVKWKKSMQIIEYLICMCKICLLLMLSSFLILLSFPLFTSIF
jgi:hypothetical protein